jgi:hypothetical protein
MITIIFMSAMFAAEPELAEPQLTLGVNAQTIRQYDQVVVKAVVVNHAQDALRLAGEPNGVGNYIRYEMKNGKGWQRVLEAGAGFFCGVTTPHILETGATYAEYDSIHLKNHKISFVFDKPGTYLLRAVVATSTGKLESKPVAVTVKARSPDELRQIESSKELLGWLKGIALSQSPRQLAELKDVGGNIGAAVERVLFLESVRSGQKRLEGDDVVKTLRTKMDGIDLEVGLHAMGAHYSQQLDWKHLQQIVDAIPDATYGVREWERNLDLHRLPEFVPSKPMKE